MTATPLACHEIYDDVLAAFPATARELVLLRVVVPEVARSLSAMLEILAWALDGERIELSAFDDGAYVTACGV